MKRKRIGRLDMSRARELVDDFIKTGKYGIVAAVIGTEMMDTEILIDRVAKAIAIGR